MPKGYLIAHVTVRDPEGYQDYVRLDTPIFERFGGRFLVRGGQSEVVEGEALERHVVIEFPDYATAKSCYESGIPGGGRDPPRQCLFGAHAGRGNLMTETTAAAAPTSTPARLTTADGKPLAQALARAQRRARRRALFLVLPLLVFVLVTFVLPIGQMLHRSLYNDYFTANMPHTVAWFQSHPPSTVPDESAYKAVALDLQDAYKARTAALAGTG